MNDFFELVRREVHINWDPIGIFKLTGEIGEYDSYVPALCELLLKRAPQDEVFQYLWTVETEAMGLEGNREVTTRFAKFLSELSKSMGLSNK